MKRCNRCAGRLEVIDGMRPTGHGPDCPYERGAKTLEEVSEIVNKVAFLDRKFRVLEKSDGYLLQLEYYEADIDNPTGPQLLQRSRKWYISSWATETEIVETAFAACLRSMRHITKEHFTYKGHRVYSPHFDINARLALAEGKMFDKRDDRRSKNGKSTPRR